MFWEEKRKAAAPTTPLPRRKNMGARVSAAPPLAPEAILHHPMTTNPTPDA